MDSEEMKKKKKRKISFVKSLFSAKQRSKWTNCKRQFLLVQHTKQFCVVHLHIGHCGWVLSSGARSLGLFKFWLCFLNVGI